MKIKLIQLTFVLLLMFSHAVLSENKNQQTSSDLVTISIKPEKNTYRSHENSAGMNDSVIDASDSSKNISFLITLKNNTSKSITVAHPFWSTLGNMKEGEIYTPEQRHNDSYKKSEMIIEITKPNGKTVTIREHQSVNSFELNEYENGRYKSKGVIKIGAKKQVTLRKGWFFQTPMARWEDKAKAWNIFPKKGTYKAKVIFRNIYPSAKVNKNPKGTSEIANVWVGELISNETIVKIQ